MKDLYFVRHGESEFNKAGKWAGSTDTPLTKKGKLQAKQAGQLSKEQILKFDVIISSPLSRARHTAKHIADGVDYPVDKILIDPKLVERNFGKLEGHRNLKASAAYLVDESSIDKYGGESLVDMQKRADKFLEYLQSLPHNSILIVGHGSFGRALRRSINKEPLHHRGERYANGKIIKLI